MDGAAPQSVGFQHRLLPGASRPPETVRPCHVPSSRSPTKERQKNGKRTGVAPELGERGFCKDGLPGAANNQIIITYHIIFSFDSAVERPILDARNLSSYTPPFQFFFFFSAACTAVYNTQVAIWVPCGTRLHNLTVNEVCHILQRPCPHNVDTAQPLLIMVGKRAYLGINRPQSRKVTFGNSC